MKPEIEAAHHIVLFDVARQFVPQGQRRFPPIAVIQIGGALAFAAFATEMGVRSSGLPVLSSMRDKPQSADSIGPLVIGTQGASGMSDAAQTPTGPAAASGRA